MSERSYAQTKNSSNAYSPAKSPESFQRPFTDERDDSPARNSNPSIQPKRSRPKIDWNRVSLVAPEPGSQDSNSFPTVQRAENSEQGLEAKEPAASSNSTTAIDGSDGNSLQEKTENSKISKQGAEQKPKIARAGLNWRNITIEAPSRQGAFAVEQPIQRQVLEEKEQSESNSLEMLDGAIQAKCSECKREEEQQLDKESIQTKLTVGAPGDKYEQVADNMAAKVMRMPDSALQQPIQRQTDSETEAVGMQPEVNSITPLVQRQTAEDSEQVQLKPNGSNQASASVESQLADSKGGGSALPDDVRSFMEPRFGADFSSIRVHTDSNAVGMNKELGAQAFTHGSDIYYGAGKSPGKDELTAHELTHTIQQTGGQRNAPATQPLTHGEEKQPEDGNQSLSAAKATPELDQNKTQPVFQQEQPNKEVANPVPEKELARQNSQTQTDLESRKTEISQDIPAAKADKSPETKPVTEVANPQ
ncbi:DUF4157 domain-containing protein [Microseira sp. BLCC-F43]|jgi:hypothetical protein|uniref:eCIS core domain-containing protein n=1 Tax=Microseira sp. BLCC-F43 TaxID=3153602 RepID=UPI0035BB5E0F